MEFRLCGHSGGHGSSEIRGDQANIGTSHRRASLPPVCARGETPGCFVRRRARAHRSRGVPLSRSPSLPPRGRASPTPASPTVQRRRARFSSRRVGRARSSPTARAARPRRAAAAQTLARRRRLHSLGVGVSRRSRAPGSRAAPPRAAAVPSVHGLPGRRATCTRDGRGATCERCAFAVERRRATLGEDDGRRWTGIGRCRSVEIQGARKASRARVGPVRRAARRGAAGPRTTPRLTTRRLHGWGKNAHLWRNVTHEDPRMRAPRA